MKKVLTILGGLLTIGCMFLVFVKADGMEVTGMDIPNHLAYVYIGAGAVIALVGFMDKKGLSILSLVLALGVLGMAIKYYLDTTKESLTVGIGLWLMIAGGALAVIGSVMGMMKKTA